MPIIGSPGQSARNYVGGNQDGLMGLGKDSNEVKFSAVEGGSEEERYEQGLSTPTITQEQAVQNYVKQFEQDRAKRSQEIEDYREDQKIEERKIANEQDPFGYKASSTGEPAYNSTPTASSVFDLTPFYSFNSNSDETKSSKQDPPSTATAPSASAPVHLDPLYSFRLESANFSGQNGEGVRLENEDGVVELHFYDEKNNKFVPQSASSFQALKTPSLPKIETKTPSEGLPSPNESPFAFTLIPAGNNSAPPPAETERQVFGDAFFSFKAGNNPVENLIAQFQKDLDAYSKAPANSAQQKKLGDQIIENFNKMDPYYVSSILTTKQGDKTLGEGIEKIIDQQSFFHIFNPNKPSDNIATISYLTDKDVPKDVEEDPILVRVDAEKPKAFALFGASMALEDEPSEPKITSNPFAFSFSASGSSQEDPAIKAKQSTIEALQNAVNNASNAKEAEAYGKALKNAQKDLEVLMKTTYGDKTEPQESAVSSAENNNPKDLEAQTRARLEKDLKEKSDRDFEIEYKFTKQQAQEALDKATHSGTAQNSNNSNGPQFTLTVDTFKSMEKKAKEEYVKDTINSLSPDGGFIRNALSNISQQDAGKLILALVQGATIVNQVPTNKGSLGNYNPANKVISIPTLTILQPFLSSSEEGTLETVIVHELLHHILINAGYQNTLAAEIAITDIGTQISGKETSLKDLEAQIGGIHTNLPLNDDGKTLDFLVRLGLLNDSRKKDLEKAYLQPKKK